MSSGPVANDTDNINCDQAEFIGQAIQQKLNDVSIEDSTIRRKDQVRTLVCLRTAVPVDKNEKVFINPLVLFSRLTTLLKQEEKKCDQFAFELTPDPTSLFKDGKMRKPVKSTLRNHVLKFDLKENKRPGADVCVVDGGMLLHNMPWFLQCTYNDLINHCLDYVIKCYGYGNEICVVFDGYEDDKSTKTQEHANHSMGCVAADIKIKDRNMKITQNKVQFLRNVNNKIQLISILQKKFEQNGITTRESYGDADVLIVQTAIERAGAGESVVMVTDDTDNLVILLHHWKSWMADIFFSTKCKEVLNQSTSSSSNTKKNEATKKNAVPMWWSIRTLVDGDIDIRCILFAHAFSGCDTTSAIHEKGSNSLLSLINGSTITTTVTNV